MIDTPLEIYVAGTLTGAGATYLLLSLLAGSVIDRLEGRVRRLRRGLEIIADLDRGPSGRSARNILDNDTIGATRG